MIELNHLVTGYRGRALSQPLSGRFAPGSLTAIMGANGAGKSTLLKTLAGLLPAVSGTVRYGQRKPQIAWLPQQSDIDHHFPLRVSDVVAMGSWPSTGMLRGMGRAMRDRIDNALAQVGLTPLAGRAISQLSGGQFQRMLFARMLVQDAQVLLLDEPFTGIDSQTSTLLLQVIDALHRKGKTIITVLHSQPVVERHFPQLLFLHEGHYHWGSTARVLAGGHARLTPAILCTTTQAPR
ncbi:metal ABC transporter ATP-binding protein [Mixta gaviniae]|uniref:ABC transporter n=1 Tax=Mixta gaviniae TaxID=665914 RepID=A0A2L0IDI6_9GAMM|nr:ABC transporter ATP-binding protein [Mixta gaviniae]AUX92549.1 ABC transporter [Mixta gaviniae]